MKASELFYNKTQKNGFYNIMPIENIKSILTNGILSHNNAKKINHNSVAMQEVQDIRENIKVPNGMYLHDYANLYFDFGNPMMYKRRNQAEHLCILKISLEVFNLDGIVVSDRNASSLYARFYTPSVGINMLDFDTIYMKNWNSGDFYLKLYYKSVKCAEILVPNKVDSKYITAACVINEINRNKLIDVGFKEEIFVSKSNFFRR
mgnify:FL=1